MINIKQLAKLSRITFNEEESDRIRKDMTAIVELMDTLKNADIPELDERANCTTLNELRPDLPIEGLSAEVLISQSAYNSGEGKLRIPKVLE